MQLSDLQIARKIREMKRGESFTIESKIERNRVFKSAKVLRQAGVITFDVTTREVEKGYIVLAI